MSTKTITAFVLLLVLGAGATMLLAETVQPQHHQPIIYRHVVAHHLPPLHLPKTVADFEVW
jgi:hypothetical protein